MTSEPALDPEAGADIHLTRASEQQVVEICAMGPVAAAFGLRELLELAEAER